MPDDYTDIFDLDDMSGDELKELVLQELREYPELDVDLIEVSARNGTVTVSGRVGTEQEMQQVVHVLTDVIGIRSVVNEMVYDEIVRGQRSEAADDAVVEELEKDPLHIQGTIRTSDEAAHLMQNVEADQFGVQDVHTALVRGTSAEPPDRPVQEGSSVEQH